jgi:hypothetical protein
MLRNWKPRPSDPERSEAAGAKARALATRPPDSLAKAAQAASAKDPELATALLGEAFLRAPKHAEADAVLRQVLPAGLSPPPRDDADYDAAEWVDFTHLVRASNARWVPPPSPDADVTPAQRVFGTAAASQWGKDPEVRQSLFALDLGDVVLTSRSRRPRNVGRCAAASQEVCRALEKMFAGGRRTAAEAPPMDVRYFSSRKEFLGVTAADFAERERRGGKVDEYVKEVERQVKLSLSGAAGVYFVDISRAHFYEPDSDDPLQPVEQVFRHELVHAWLDLRNPRRLRARDLERERALQFSPGQWTTEGFPTFLQEQVIDPASGEVSENGASFTLDFVAHAEPLLPWATILNLPRWRLIDAEKDTGLPWQGILAKAAQAAGWTELPHARLATHLGSLVVFDPTQVFYRQAAAACHYLYFGEGGKHRQRLVDFICDYDSGEPAAKLDFETYFGVDPDELGERVEAYARKKFGR